MGPCAGAQTTESVRAYHGEVSVTVGELVAMPHLGLRLHSGAGGLGRTVTWTHTSELPEPWPWVSAVSYTHLDVYKRQRHRSADPAGRSADAGRRGADLGGEELVGVDHLEEVRATVEDREDAHRREGD